MYRLKTEKSSRSALIHVYDSMTYVHSDFFYKNSFKIPASLFLILLFLQEVIFFGQLNFCLRQTVFFGRKVSEFFQNTEFFWLSFLRSGQKNAWMMES